MSMKIHLTPSEQRLLDDLQEFVRDPLYVVRSMD